MTRRLISRLFTAAMLLILGVATGGSSPDSATAAPVPQRDVPEWLTDGVAHPPEVPPVVDTAPTPTSDPVEMAPSGVRNRTNGVDSLYFEANVTDDFDVAQLEAAGAVVVGQLDSVVLIKAQGTATRRLMTLPGLAALREPADLRAAMVPMRIEAGTGSALADANRRLHEAGHTGSGVTIGVIDFFDPALFPGQVATGDIPNIPVANRRCFYLGSTCPFGTPGVDHGNNVLELVHDGAPGATLFVAEVGTIIDYRNAIDWFSSNGVTIVNHSLVGPIDGPGNGTGPSASVVDYAVSKGIAWFNAAGNAGADPEYASYQGGYWRGVWSDANNNRWLNFYGTDESLGVYCGALMGMRWSDWGAIKTDYDLYVTDLRISTRTNSSTKKLVSANNQLGGAAPIEGADMRWLCNTNSANGPVYDTNGDGFVSLWVQRKSASTAASSVGDVIEIIVNGGWFEYSSSAGSAAIPFGDSANPGMASIGAGAGLLTAAGFSAQGPTNDGRIKPDFVGEACNATSLNGECHVQGFAGTSSSSPARASDAAVLRGMLGPMTPAQLIQTLRNTAASSNLPHASSLPNNQIGWGYARLDGELPELREWGSSFRNVTPIRMLDTRRADPMVWMGPKTIAPHSAIAVPMWWLTGKNATAVAVNITIVDSQQQGYVQAYPSRMAIPGTSSSVNVDSAGRVVANFAIVPLGLNGMITLHNTAGGHLLVDLVGYFTNTAGYERLNTVDPYRLYDSQCDGCTRLVGGQPLDVTVLGTGDLQSPFRHVPVEDVSAVIVSVTAVSPAPVRGFISAVPVSASYPVSTSTANYRTGASVSGTAIVPIVAGSPNIRIFSSHSTDVQVDIIGYFAKSAPGGIYYPITPARFMDSRIPTGSPKVAADTPVTVQIADRFGVPADAGAVVHNFTVTQSDAAGEARLAAGTSPPEGTYRSLMIGTPVSPMSNGGVIALREGSVTHVTTNTTHRILDVTGWFTGGDEPMPAGHLTTLTGIDGAAPNGAAFGLALSSTGRYVAFGSKATNIVATDTDTFRDVLLWDRQTGLVTRASVSDDEQPANGDSKVVGVSTDGNEVLFTSVASNLVAGDDNNRLDLFARNISAGTTTRVIADPTGGVTPAQDVTRYQLSDDADTVVLSTKAQLVPEDTDASADLYLLTRSTGVLELIYDPGYTGPNTPVHSLLFGSGDMVSVGGFRWERGVGLLPFPLAHNVGGFDSTGTKYVYVVPEPIAGTNLVYGKLYLHDLTTGTSTYVCTLPSQYAGPRLDGEGNTVLSREGCGTTASSLSLIEDGVSTEIDRTWNGHPSGSAQTPYMSHDGKVVAFLSGADNLLPVSNGQTWVYVYEVPATP